MNIIPVLDLLNGVVVHAKKGLRAQYLPIESQLTASIHATDIVKAFLDIYPFQTLYIADLNAIQKTSRANNFNEIDKIKADFPSIKIWLDVGVKNTEDLKFWQSLEIHPVIGSENLASFQAFSLLNDALKGKFSLSLDFMPQGYQGPIELLQANTWPQEVIAMTLAKVGANAGVDLATIQTILAKKTKQHIYAAGGIRNIEDLNQLNELKVQGALIASALHNKKLQHQAIAGIS